MVNMSGMFLSPFRRSRLYPEVSILIPTMFDSKDIIELCVKSIQKNTADVPYRIIICDAGADETARKYLEQLASSGQIELIQATDWQRPKDDLAAAARTPYYLIIHDDTYIKHRDWLRRRMDLMLSDERNAVVGITVPNYGDKGIRFFPLGMLVKRAAAEELDIKWGKQVEQGYDTGAIAYKQFMGQTKYRFVKYKPSRDIHHFSQMTWPVYKREMTPEIVKLLAERDEKLKKIRHMLEYDEY